VIPFPSDVDDLLPPLQSHDRLGRMLTPIVYAGVASLLVVIAVAWPVARWPELLALGVEAAALVGSVLLIRRRKIRASVWLCVVAFVLASAAVVLSYGSLRTVGTYGFVFAAIMAAVSLPRRDIAAALVLTWLVIGALTWVELSRTVPVPPRPFSWAHAVMLGTGLLFVVFVVGYAREVAALAVRKQRLEFAERERAEERLRLSMEATRQAWFDLDLDTGIVVASDTFARLIGGAVSDGPATGAAARMTRDSWIAAIHHDDRAQVLQRFERCLRTGETEQMDYRLLGLDGTFRWVRSIAKVVQRTPDGRPVRMTGTHLDITEQMGITQALEASERSYRALVEMSPLGVMVLHDGVVRYANPAAVAMLGATDADALRGAPMRRFVPADTTAWLDARHPGAEGGRDRSPTPEERLLQRMNGDTFEAGILCTAVIHEGMPSVQFTLTDLSTQKVAEEARLRSRQLAALGTLAGGIAHDFNNILMAIRGNAELVATEDSLSPEAAEHIREIVLAGQRASELVRRITSFARPREPQQHRVHLGEVLHEVLRLLRPTIPAGISLVVHDDADAPPILADSGQVHETILNLTTNAVYAIGSRQVGVVTYTVDSVALEGEAASTADVPAGRYTRLTVRDTGPGMSTETQRRIFDAFYTTKPVGEGSGLGLSMAYGTMRSHGGAILVDSRIGEGATFHLLFPSAPVSEPQPLALAVPDVVLPPQLRVLFVDDEPQLVRLAQRTLAPLGHTVTSFSSPLEAVEAFRATPLDFDVVMTDLSMPGMSGIDLARAVRRERADVPIVLVTGYADETDERAARDAGVTRLAVKASDARQLTRLLAEVMGQPVSS
jgi:PAS domain S-box-containing protein